MRLWDRGEPIDAQVLAYTAGEDFMLDERLVRYDLAASAAHAAMLHHQGYLSTADLDALLAGLQELGRSHAAGEWKLSLDEEDCHTAIENRLAERTGEAGRRIHLGRSRNDQVLAALRLWLLDALKDLASEAEGVAASLDDLAARHGSLELPGYTHLQRATPSSVALWAGGFAAEIRDDAVGLMGARRRAALNPLGSAAGYGAPALALDREQTTVALGFEATQIPVTAVQLSRGKAEATALFEATLLARDLGRLASDLCLFATKEFGFVRLPVAFTTGSSMLPQKRNPDVFELARGRTAEAHAALSEVLSIAAGLPSGYHRDLQGIKKPLFRGIDSVMATASMMAHAIPGIAFVPEKLASASADPGLRAAEHANRMVAEESLSFREAYRRVKEEFRS
jgi:argininosuccinate lyase